MKTNGPDDQYDDTIHRVHEKAEEIGTKFHKQKALRSLLDKGMVMIDMVRDYATGRYREVPYWAMGATALALFYVLSPVDVIPDFVIGLGYLDDAVVVSFALRLIEKELDRYKEWKARQKGEAGKAPTTGSGSGKVVDV